MATKVAINGFGRIGRLVARAILERPDCGLELVAINDLADARSNALLFKRDSVHGPFPGEVKADGNDIVVNGKRIPVAIDSISEFFRPSRGLKIVNTSLVFGSFPGACDSANAFTQALAQAVNALRARGTLTVSSAGNAANKGEIGAPACLSGAIGVGAVYDGNVGTISFGCRDGSTSSDKIACFSNSSSAVAVLMVVTLRPA